MCAAFASGALAAPAFEPSDADGAAVDAARLAAGALSGGVVPALKAEDAVAARVAALPPPPATRCNGRQTRRGFTFAGGSLTLFAPPPRAIPPRIEYPCAD